MTIKAVLFDLDGTLLDTAPDFIRVVNILRAQESLPTMDHQLIRNTVSNGARALVELGFGLRERDDGFDAMRQRLLDLYLDNLAVDTRPFDGITETLALLAENQIAWGVVTNKPVRYAQPLMQQINLYPACASLICPDHVQQSKPDPEGLHLACRQIGCDSHEAIYVGDHLRDIEAGHAAGMITVAAGYGYIEAGDNPAKWQAHHLVEDAKQLPELMAQLLSSANLQQTDASHV